jgi:hypothetical protein
MAARSLEPFDTLTLDVPSKFRWTTPIIHGTIAVIPIGVSLLTTGFQYMVP